MICRRHTEGNCNFIATSSAYFRGVLSKNVFLVRSQADPNVLYEVERLENNQTVFSCGCKDFLYRMSKGTVNGLRMPCECKHIKSVVLFLQQKELLQNVE